MQPFLSENLKSVEGSQVGLSNLFNWEPSVYFTSTPSETHHVKMYRKEKFQGSVKLFAILNLMMFLI